MKNNLTLLAREGKAKTSQNTGGGTSQQSTAQHDRARVFEYFNTQMARFLWSKKGEATVSEESCSWAQGRATSAEQPTNHALITHLSPTQTVSLARIWKYVACLLLVLFVGVGNVWGDNEYLLSKVKFTNGDMVAGMSGASVQWLKYDGTSFSATTDFPIPTYVDNEQTKNVTGNGFYCYEETITGIKNVGTGTTWSSSSNQGKLIQMVKLPNGKDVTLALGTKVATKITIIAECGSAGAKTITIGGISHSLESTAKKNTLFSHEFTKSGNFTGDVTISQDADFYAAIILTVPVTYTITVNPGGGETSTEGWTLSTGNYIKSGITSGTSVTLPTMTQLGYGFNGWKDNHDNTISSPITITKDTTLVAQWTLSACTDVDAPTELAKSEGTTSSLTFTWTKATNAVGYVAKLYSDAECESEVDSKVLEDVATVTFDELDDETIYYCKVQSKGDGSTYCVNGGTTDAVSGKTDAIPSHSVGTGVNNALYGSAEAASSSVKEGATTTITATPASGYKFVSWALSGAGAASASLSSTSTNPTTLTMGSDDVTVTATFEQVCYLTLYDLTGEAGSAEVTTATATVNEGESLVMSNTDGRIKLTPVSGQKIKNGDEIVFTGTVGTPCDNKKPFGIKIYASDGSTKSAEINVANKCVDDGSMTLSGTLSKLGDGGADYIFIARSGGTTTTLTSCVVRREITCPEELDAITGLALSATSSTSLTFTWDEVTNASSYDVYLYEDEDCEILVGSKANVTTTSKEFTGLTPNTDYYCKVQAIGDGVSYTDGPLSDYLNGKTNEAPKYDVTYVSAKGVAPSEAEQVYSVVLPQISPVTGFVHTGWTAGQAVVVDEETVTAGTTIAIGKTAVLSANTTFTAVWTTAYTLTLDPKGGTTEDDSWTYDDVNDLYSKVVAEGADVDLPTFTKTNRTFKTWRNNADAEDEYAEEGSVTVSADMTLNAIWNATVEQVIYSWEGAEGGATEVGGTAVGSAENMINQKSGDYYCLKVDGKADWSGTNISITLNGSEKVKTGDKIKFTAFYNKSKEGAAQAANSSLKMFTATTSGTQIFDMGDSELLPNIYGGGNDPANYTKTVPAGIDVSTVYMTRSQTGSNAWITKLQIVREVTTEESNLLTVTFNSNGGSDVASVVVVSGSKVAKPADPTKSGYRFVKWQKAGADYDFSTAVTANITLDAVWTQLYAVTYAAGEGSGTMAADAAAEGDKVTLKANGFTAPDGKVFDAWVVAPTAGGDPITVTAGKFTMPAAAVTATATWKATYTVNYIDEDGTTPLGSEEVAVGSHPTASGISAEQDYKTLTWLQSSVAVDLDEVSAAAGETVELVASYAPAYASSINIEQWVLDNRKNNTAFRAVLDAKYFKYANLNDLDSLTAEKNDGDRNYPFLGQKWKLATSEISFLLKEGSTVNVRFGNMGSSVNVKIGSADAVELTSGDYANSSLSSSKEYSYTATEDVIVKFQGTGTGTVVFKQIMIDEAIATVKLPAIVTYDANGGSFSKASEKYTGTPLVIGDATPADADYEFEGWHVGTVEGAKIDASAYVPTKNVTLVAKYVVKPSPFSLSALTFTIGDGEAQEVGYVEGTYEYDVELPYAPSYETITVAYTLADGTSSEKAGAVLSVTSVPGAATLTIVAANTTEKTYTVNFKKEAKDGLEIIGATVSTNTTADMSGLYGGTASVNLNSKKIDNGGYIYITLPSGYTFEETDVLVVNVNTKADIGTKALEITTGVGNIDGEVWKTIAFDDYSTGNNTIALTGIVANQTSIGLKRSSNQNAKINSLKVYRPMNPVLKSITIDGTKIDVAGTTAGETLPYATDLAEVTPEIFWNGAGTAVVTTNEGEWKWGGNTYVLTDKDGDATTYTITLTRATRSSDKSLSSLTVDGNAVELKEGVYDYIYEYPYGTNPATEPAVAAEANDAHASVGTITQAASTAGTASFTVTAEDETEQEYTVSFKISRVPGLVIYDGSTGATAFSATTYEDEDTHFAWSIGSNISVSADNAPASSTWGGKTYTKILKGFKPNNNSNNIVSFTVPSGYLAKIRLVGSTNKDGTERKMFIAEEATNDASKAIGNYVITSSTYEAQGFVTELLMPGTYYLGSTDTYRLFEFSAQLYPIDKTRTGLAQGMLGTVCLPNGGIMVGASIFEVAYMDYEADGTTPHKIYFDEVLGGVMEAGMPYVILPNEGSSQFVVTYTDDANAAAKSKNGLVGYLGDLRALAENDYFIYNNMFYYVSSADAASERIRISAERAYINLSQVPGYHHESPKPASVGRRRIAMSNANPAPQVATGIGNVQGNQVQNTKVMIDGQLFIIHGEKMYNATGILVK